MLRRHLLAEHLLEEVGIGQILGRSVLQHGFQTLGTLLQAQLVQMLAEALQLRRRRNRAPGGGFGRGLRHHAISRNSRFSDPCWSKVS